MLNRKYRGRFRLIKGIEANIRADGSVDMEPDELRELELVVAAPHSALQVDGGSDRADGQRGQDRRASTSSVTRAAGSTDRARRHGRLGRGLRGGAATANVAIEIDGDPSRQDSTTTSRERAVDAGCLFALDSDAHSTPELRYAETAIAHARLAGVPADRIVNCWPTDKLLAWLARSELSSVAPRLRS